MSVSAVLMQSVWASVPVTEVKLMVALSVTVIVPFNELLPHVPSAVTVKLYVPGWSVEPLIVKTLPLKLPVIPVGNPATFTLALGSIKYVIGIIEAATHSACALLPEVNVIVQKD